MPQRKLFVVILVLVASLFGQDTSIAAPINWKNAVSGNWSEPSNWDPATVPGPADAVFTDVIGTYEVTLNASAEAQTPEVCQGWYIGTYTGDLSGVMRVQFDVTNTYNCNPTPLGSIYISVEGALPQFFWEDVTRTLLGTGSCVSGDASFTTPGSAYGATGNLREILFSGAMDLNQCAVSGTWSSHGLSGGFTLSHVPFLFWRALNGDFYNTSNWEPELSPNRFQTAVFDRAQTYAVSFPLNSRTRGVIVERGDLTFIAGSYTATGGTETAPSALVGNSSVDVAALTLASHRLTTAFSTLALDPGTTGVVSVESGSTWTEQTRMVVGKAGSGGVSIEEGAIVTSLETQIGADASGDGNVIVGLAPVQDASAAEWTTGSIAVGLRGIGTVNHFGGFIRSHTVSVGVEPGSRGTANIGSASDAAVWVFDGPLTVGERGEGQFNIVAEGSVISTSSAAISVGEYEGGAGTLRIEGAGSTLIAPDSYLGLGINGGTGLVTLANGATLTCDVALIGNSGPGRLLISDSKFTCVSLLTSPIGMVILNNGTLCVANVLGILEGTLGGKGLIVAPDSNISGVVSPGAVDLPIPAPKGLESPDEPIGTLTFGGDVDFGSATLEIDVSGLAAGAYDVLHATGAVDIRDSTVMFSFIDGFLPQTGDSVPFLVAGGGLTLANLILEFEGVAEGFQFDLMEEEGMLLFHALTDAQPTDAEPTPIPTALNPDADVNGDHIIDASDLLEIQRNWYRIVPQ